MSFSRHSASNSGLSLQRSSTSWLTSETAPARAASTLNDPDDETGDGVPIMLRGSDMGVAEHEAKNIALARRERAIVGQHRSGGAIPRDDIPGGGLDQGGTDLERIEHALQTGCDPFRGLVADLG